MRIFFCVRELNSLSAICSSCVFDEIHQYANRVELIVIKLLWDNRTDAILQMTVCDTTACFCLFLECRYNNTLKIHVLQHNTNSTFRNVLCFPWLLFFWHGRCLSFSVVGRSSEIQILELPDISFECTDMVRTPFVYEIKYSIIYTNSREWCFLAPKTSSHKQLNT